MRGRGTACVLERESPRALREELEPDVHQADERVESMSGKKCAHVLYELLLRIEPLPIAESSK